MLPSSSSPASLKTKELGRNLRNALTGYGFQTLKDAAKAVGWNQSLIRDRCNGNTQIKVLDIVEISQAVSHVDPMVLFARIINAENPSAAWDEKEIKYLIQLLRDRMNATARMSYSNSENLSRFQNNILTKLYALKDVFDNNNRI